MSKKQCTFLNLKQNKALLDFHSGSVVEDLSANTKDTVLIPGPGRFHMLQGNKSHVPQLLNRALEPMLHNKIGHCNKEPEHCN